MYRDASREKKMKHLHILIVEDESIVALNLAAKIQDYGVNVVDFACSYEEAQEALATNPQTNLIIMDINLEESRSGIDFINSLAYPIDTIYLTAYSDDKTILQASKTLPLGYLVKPLVQKELFILLQIAAQKHTAAKNGSEVVTLGMGYSFNTTESRLYKDGTYVKLLGKKLQLLALLVERQGRFITFNELEERLYQSEPPSDSALRTLIYRLRSSFKHDLIVTERYYGVKLLLPQDI